MLHDGAISGTFNRSEATPELLMQAALGGSNSRLDGSGPPAKPEA
jgi:hypothetical protein